MTTASSNGAFHRLTLQPIIQSLENLDAILKKAEAHAEKEQIEPAALLATRLFPNMFTLIQQLQYSLYIPADLAQHFADEPAPKVGYEEATFADVHASIATAITYLKSITPARMDERATRTVPLFYDSTRGMPAEAYAAGMTMPDFYFHLTAAYAILRHVGVPLGKDDFIGKLEVKAIG